MWISIPYGAIKRLHGNLLFGTDLSISIPYGAIKSTWYNVFHRCIRISIPYGAIKSLFLWHDNDSNKSISIPYGAIKSLILRSMIPLLRLNFNSIWCD